MGSPQTVDMGITSNTTSLAVAESLGMMISDSICIARSWVCSCVCEASVVGVVVGLEERRIRSGKVLKLAPSRRQGFQVGFGGTAGLFRITGAQVVVIAVLIAGFASVGNPWSHTTQTSLTEEVQENLN